jgi:hypothetical protein
MAGPFPGMGPSIELQAAWPDFHNGLIAEIRVPLVVFRSLWRVDGEHRESDPDRRPSP